MRGRPVVIFGVVALLTGCDYVRLLRPSVLKQLNPDVVRLVNFLPEVDVPNEAMLGQLPGHGGLVDARLGSDGVMRASIRAAKGKFMWKPAIVVMSRGGRLELDVSNDDAQPHSAMVASTPGRQYVELPSRTRARMVLQLDQPGLYTFACTVANHAGRGMLGFILVKGETPDAARLDRPPQPRP